MISHKTDERDGSHTKRARRERLERLDSKSKTGSMHEMNGRQTKCNTKQSDTECVDKEMRRRGDDTEMLSDTKTLKISV